MKLSLRGLIWLDNEKINLSFYEDTSLPKLKQHINQDPDYVKPYNNTEFWVKSYSKVPPVAGKTAHVVVQIMNYSFKSTRGDNVGKTINGCYLKLLSVEYL